MDTGKFTGRSPLDKYFVKRPGSVSDKEIWWGSVNQPMQPEVFEDLKAMCVNHFNETEEAYGKNLFC